MGSAAGCAGGLWLASAVATRVVRWGALVFLVSGRSWRTEGERDGWFGFGVVGGWIFQLKKLLSSSDVSPRVIALGPSVEKSDGSMLRVPGTTESIYQLTAQRRMGC